MKKRDVDILAGLGITEETSMLDVVQILVHHLREHRKVLAEMVCMLQNRRIPRRWHRSYAETQRQWELFRGNIRRALGVRLLPFETMLLGGPPWLGSAKKLEISLKDFQGSLLGKVPDSSKIPEQKPRKRRRSGSC